MGRVALQAEHRGVALRMKEHMENSAKHTEQLKSRLYRSYPTGDPVTSKVTPQFRRRGKWSQLDAYLGAVFEWKDGEEAIKCFNWPSKTMQKLDTANWGASPADRQMKMVGYALELGYDLMLNSVHRVSSAPGFEAPTGYTLQKRRSGK